MFPCTDSFLPHTKQIGDHGLRTQNLEKVVKEMERTKDELNAKFVVLGGGKCVCRVCLLRALFYGYMSACCWLGGRCAEFRILVE